VSASESRRASLRLPRDSGKVEIPSGMACSELHFIKPVHGWNENKSTEAARRVYSALLRAVSPPYYQPNNSLAPPSCSHNHGFAEFLNVRRRQPTLPNHAFLSPSNRTSNTATETTLIRTIWSRIFLEHYRSRKQNPSFPPTCICIVPRPRRYLRLFTRTQRWIDSSPHLGRVFDMLCETPNLIFGYRDAGRQIDRQWTRDRTHNQCS
jgi:hypothetical protein